MTIKLVVRTGRIDLQVKQFHQRERVFHWHDFDCYNELFIYSQKFKIMAELDVQPRERKSSIIPWLLLALGVIALVVFLTRNNDRDENREATKSTTTYNNTTEHAAAGTAAWSDINFSAPRVSYDEVGNRDIQVRGNEDYAIYSLEENLLFDKDQAALKSGAEESLRDIAASINKRYQQGMVRIYGFTDSDGSDAHNKQLAQQRAQTVRDWLVQQGSVPQDRISLQAEGEQHPVASNDSEKGKQQNRRVEIVARRS
jgi:outer membrane protein OmpA-like peptidoglycan-associated protein